MKILVTVLICAVIVAICIYTVINMIKKSKNGGCSRCSGCSAQGTCSTAEAYPHTYKVYIDGMSCGHCKARVEELFKGFESTTAEVNLDGKYALVKSKFAADEEKIRTAVNNLGFEFKSIEG